MIPLLVLAGISLVSVTAWILKRKGYDKYAAYMAQLNGIGLLLARGYLAEGEKKAVSYALKHVTPEDFAALCKQLGLKPDKNDLATVRGVRAHLEKTLLQIMRNLERLR